VVLANGLPSRHPAHDDAICSEPNPASKVCHVGFSQLHPAQVEKIACALSQASFKVSQGKPLQKSWEPFGRLLICCERTNAPESLPMGGRYTHLPRLKSGQIKN
jgi:hypothetical protein